MGLYAMPEQRVFAVMGIGSIGLRHASNLRHLRPDAKIIAISESLEGRGGLSAFPVFDVFYQTLKDALACETLNGLIVCTAANSHLAILKEVIKQGIPVLMEKPLSTTAVNNVVAQELMQASIPIHVGYNLRYTHGFARVQQIVASGVLGPVTWVHAEVGQYLPDWRPASDYRKTVTAQRRLGGGVLLELSHELDYLTALFGFPQDVYARIEQTGLLEMDAEDQADILLGYAGKNPMTVSVHLDCLQRKVSRSLKLVGARGTLEWDLIGKTLALHCENSKGKQTSQTWQLLEDTGNWMYLAEMEEFLVACRYWLAQKVFTSTIAATVPHSIQLMSLIDSIHTAHGSKQRIVFDGGASLS